ncbi:hypothetical protein AB836_01595 [Rickettsiales bacterium (ex Bugula neritina AB1)]|nr:hypothetical protein AB836_01595 [Rickettsiales bacterium (ex Bugula neritina AB1)]
MKKTLRFIDNKLLFIVITTPFTIGKIGKKKIENNLNPQVVMNKNNTIAKNTKFKNTKSQEKEKKNKNKINDSVKKHMSVISLMQTKLPRINSFSNKYINSIFLIYLIKYGLLIYSVISHNNKNIINNSFLESYMKSSLLTNAPIKNNLKIPLYILNSFVIIVIIFCWISNSVSLLSTLLSSILVLILFSIALMSINNTRLRNGLNDQNFFQYIPYSVLYVFDMIILNFIGISKNNNSKPKVHMSGIFENKKLNEKLKEYNNILLEEEKASQELVF